MVELRLGRFALAGLIAGVVIDLGELVLNAVVLAGEWEATMTSLERPPVSAAAIVWLNVMGLALGVVAVLLFALLRGRLDDRAATLAAATFSWFLSYGLGFGWSFVLGVYSFRLYFCTLAWSLPELLLATAAGVWVYRRL